MRKRTRIGLWACAALAASNLLACGNACTLAGCINRLEGAIAAGDVWPEGFCESASGVFYQDERATPLDATNINDPESEFWGVQCVPGTLTVAWSGKVDTVWVELSDGATRMVVSTDGSERISRTRPNGPECDPVCSTHVTTITMTDE